MSSKAKHAVATAMVAASMAVAGTAFSANDMFIKLETIKGESMDNAHKGEIDVLSWSWGAGAPANEHAPTAAAMVRSAPLRLDQISITKHIDAASASLIQVATSGKHIPQAVITVRKPGSNPVDVLVIKLKDVVISSIQEGGTGSNDVLTESITFSFASADFTYTGQTATGKAPPATVTWSLAAPGKV
jgi:type VI secretion system secreted protein Hcp